MENMSIRTYAKEHGVRHWELAEALGIPENSFSRKLRRELPSDQQAHILRVIEQIAERKAEKEAEGKEGGF